MPVIKSKKKDNLYANPPALKECFTIDGLGKEPVHCSVDSWFHLRQGSDRIELSVDQIPALIEALTRLSALDTYYVYERKYIKEKP